MENNYPPISFENTEFAFQYKPNNELNRAKLLFTFMSKPWLVKIGARMAPWALRVGLPVKGIIRKTIFKQFVGGETLEETAQVAKKLGEYNVKIILDYGVEGKEGEENFDNARDMFVKVIEYAATQPNIPYMSVKVTGFARFALLEKMNDMMAAREGTLMQRFEKTVADMSQEDRDEWGRVYQRVNKVCETAALHNIGVSIDAEETWITDPLDALTIIMMSTYNKGRIIVYNTLQMYRHDRLQFLLDSYDAAVEKDFILGSKLVRGAYMEKERRRAAEKGYPSPIQPDKESTDRDYNAGVKFCIDNISRVALMVASHNEYSNMYAADLLMERGLPLSHPYVHWSQLYGMSDNITFNLAKAGCSVSKYLPFGPIKDVISYLMRRAQENTSVKGQTSREMNLINTECARRKKAKE
ncbi:MAG: proline dehydrogenase family protein [Chitinophagaceae bacterium]|nr:proline dehydrogenase family protein [Chitinophagaceae bacterium]